VHHTAIAGVLLPVPGTTRCSPGGAGEVVREKYLITRLLPGHLVFVRDAIDMYR